MLEHIIDLRTIYFGAFIGLGLAVFLGLALGYWCATNEVDEDEEE